MAVAWRPSQLLIFIGLLVCGIVAIEATRGIQEVHGTVARDLQSVWYLAVAITLPPAYALLAPIPMAAYRLLRVRRGMVYKRVFSNATLSLAYGAASVAFRMIRGSGIGPQPGTGATVLTWTASLPPARSSDGLSTTAYCWSPSGSLTGKPGSATCSATASRSPPTCWR